MKKFILVGFVSAVFIIVALMTAAVIISFTVIKPTTDSINQKLLEKFAKIVRIPQGILPPVRGINTTSYFWEMETIENEVTGVRFMYDPAFTSDKIQVEAILEMPANSDASLFNKVLPAVIVDERTIKNAQDIEKADLSANRQAGYSKVNFLVKPNTKQVTAVIWTFDKNQLDEDLMRDYQKLSKYPLPLFGFLFELPIVIFGLLAG